MSLPPTHIAIRTWLALIRAEYAESPGLELTLAQAQRFWGLDEVVGPALFATLADAGVLKLTRHGTYIRADIN